MGGVEFGEGGFVDGWVGLWVSDDALGGVATYSTEGRRGGWMDVVWCFGFGGQMGVG